LLIYLLVADFAITKNLFLGCCFGASSKATRTGWSTVDNIAHASDIRHWLAGHQEEQTAG
jgi:hypothetical protein